MTRLQQLALGSALCALATPLLPAKAQAQDSGPVVLDEVIVTAQRREENLQDVPVSVSAFTPTELERQGITDTTDLMGALPNIQVTSAYGRTQPNFSVRGISVANEFSASTASPIGVYVDEVYQGFRASHGQQLFDLEGLEVLRGPQGTLFGRNTTGGAVNIATRKPGLDGNNGYVTAGYGNFDTKRLAGAAEATLSENFGVRIAGIWEKSDGYTENVFDGLTYSGTDSIAGRISARWAPTDATTVDAKLYIADNDPRQDLPYGIGYLPGGANGAGVSLRAGLDEDQIAADTAGRYRTSSEGATLSVEHAINDAWTFNFVGGIQKDDYDLSPFDCDGGPVDVCAIEYFSKSESWNLDARLTYTNDRMVAVLGAYAGDEEIFTKNQPDFFGFLSPLLQGAGLPGTYFNPSIAVGNSLGTIPAFAADPTLDPLDPASCAPIVLNPNGLFDARQLIAFNTDVAAGTGAAIQAACTAAGAPPFGNILVDQEFTIDRPSQAIYGEIAYDVTDRFTATLGLRYTNDDITYRDAYARVANLEGNFVAALVPYIFDPTDVANNVTLRPEDIPKVRQEENTGELSGRLVLDYKFTDEVLGYASYSRGYRAGSFNGLAYQDISQVFFVEPENIDAFEVGVKSRLFDNRVQLNAAAFYYDYKNQQIAEIVGATSFLRSVDGRVFGAEAELDWQVSDTLLVEVNGGFLDTKYDANQSFTPGGLDVGRNEFPNAPNVTAQAGATWTAWEDGDNSVVVRADAQYMGEYFFDPFNSYNQDPCDQPGPGQTVLLASPELACGNPDYILLNGRISYEAENYTLSAYARNITDKFYYTYGLNLNAFFQDYLVRGEPRTYGVEATFRF
ncbi:MAG: TonB-dependent receptor [Litorimonas sp.]